ncbi:hypothetical protein JTB14_010882 [Gonioctena quinquepunctata]|nr:hypothetical protein JTB14_010882 [Gonioctena quinquepunctata]
MNLGGAIHLNKSGICVVVLILIILFLYSISSGKSIEESVSSRKIELGALVEVAVKAAENGGYKVVQTKDNLKIKSKGLTKEGLVDSVTTADFLSHCAMMETMKHYYPSINIVSEEAKTVCEEDPSIDFALKKSSRQIPKEFVEEKDVTVWIDPLDATYEFTAKLYKYVTTMVCVAVKGKPIIGVIHRPFNSTTSWAWVGKAKSDDLKPVLGNSLEKDLKVIVSLSHRGEIEKVLKDNFGDTIQVITAAGAGYKALEVAAGNVDAYLHITAIKKWDICAGNAMLNALGGKLTTKVQSNPFYIDLGKMIELTVKTLDSQNHQFTVEDDITVEQFKTRIAETVNIPADTQRIIYCGRVLQDSSKLADYDVNGKVVHLVQRPPPGTNPRPTSRSTSPQPQRRGFRGFRGLEQGNAMYLGSMAFPGNLMESQGIVPPPPTHSLSGSRLNVAKRMLRRAEAVIQTLENPSARPQEQPAPDENQEEEEEVTPVIEARVIVPSNIDPIDEVLSAVQNTFMNAATNAVPLSTASTEAGSSAAPSNTDSAQRSANHSETSTPGGVTPRSSSTENLNAESRTENGLPENTSRTSEMATLLTMLGQLQTRFAPFLEQYQNFMLEDPEIIVENVQRQTQIMLNRVSEVMHFLGHAYHSLSDIMIRVRTPPPRPLLCRPILIQHSAVVQTGIPIQVEINLSADRPPTSNTAQTTNAATDGNAATTTAPPATPTQNTNTANGGPSISVQPGFVGLPFLPGAAMRVQSFPVEIRAMRSASAMPRPQNNNNNTMNTEPTSGPTPASAASGGNEGAATSTNAGNSENAQQGTAFNFNNPNVEFFMEVTPEGITIDSLETTLVGSNQANDLLRGALNGPPPEFLQSLMQMAGQIINRNIPTTAGGTATGSTAAGTGTSTAETTQSSPQSGASQGATPLSGQNSQARGNTQTNPTTATHTRSTPRPHVHLAQQAMQGGFDPFLPCNSHHISRRRRHAHMAAAAAPPSSSPTNQQTASAQNSPSNRESASGAQTSPNASARQQNPSILSFFNNIFGSVRSEFRRPNEATPPSAANASSGGAASGDVPNLGPFASLFSSMQGGGNLPDLIRQGPTLEQILIELQPDDQYVPGESIITDLIMLFVRNCTLVDLFTLNSGNMEPINRNVTEIQNFFRTRVCDGDTTPSGVDRGVDRLIAEMRPFLESFRTMAVRDDIDMVRSAEQLFRQRLPNIINIAINLNTNSVRLLLDQCLTTAKQLLALVMLASSDGQPGVERTIEQLMNHFIHDVPQDIRNWTLMTSRVHLRGIISNLSIPESILRPYIVRQSDAVITSVVENRQPVSGDVAVTANVTSSQGVEAMEFDTVESNGDLQSPTLVIEDTEPLPNVVLGSEPWHGQVPEDWVPIITRDAQRQRRQNSQGPFSDAYLSGMPSKRRKIVNSSKPQGSLPQVITDSMRQAISATGLTSVAPLETVSQAAGASLEIQTAYRNLLRTTVQASLRDNEDFLPERFPNASNYFNNDQQ